MYSYEEAMKDDIREFLDDVRNGNWNVDINDRDALYDAMWADDGVTGNGSGSYWFSTEKAKEAFLGDDNADDYVREAMNDFGIGAEEAAKHLFDWEYWDVTIRCYLLGTMLDDVLAEEA